LLFAVVSLLFFAARTAATNFYRPFLLVANTVYLLLRYFRYGWEVPSFWGSVGIFSLWALEYFAYIGILDNAVNRSVGDKGLVGGSSLDLLGLVVLVQFGTILFSPKFYWLLAVLPPWGAWTLYKLFAVEMAFLVARQVMIRKNRVKLIIGLKELTTTSAQSDGKSGQRNAVKNGAKT